MLDAVAPYLPNLSAGTAVFAFAIVFAAGVLRGFTGFGFALAAVPTLTLFIDPIEAVPATLIVALIAGAELIPKAWPHVEWRSMRLLLAGAVAGTPLGVYALSALPSNVMRGVIGAIVLLSVALLWRGYRFQASPPRAARIGIGMLSGLLNGGTAMGGPPVIIYFLATSDGVAIGRASMLVYFFFAALWSVTVAGAANLLDGKTIVFAALMLPFMAIGNRIGDRWFNKSSSGMYYRVALAFLAAVAVLALGRA
ncbi:MAG: sulfite exporter TauE/SafE family protein, partial [Dongiaceae bacterium]